MNPEQKDKHLSKKIRWSAALLLAGFLLSFLFPSLNWRVQAAPRQAAALDVIINEVAWAGTEAFGGDEWLELYNPSSTDINLDGWVLTNESGSFYISFDITDVILQNTYFLIERGGGNATSELEQKTYSSGSLSDSGEKLFLLDDSRIEIDTANGNGGAWPNGLLSPASSMERMSTSADADDNWVTNTGVNANGLDAAGNNIKGSPGKENLWGYNVTHTFTPVPSLAPSPTLTPTPTTSLELIINEVGWGGTEASNLDEWIELYNPNLYDIPLAGWELVSIDGGLDIALSGTIIAGDYFLLEHDDDDTIKPVIADQIYSGTLSNDGEYLRLLAPGGNIVDTANKFGGDWPAGSASPDFGSMERSGVVADGSMAWFTFDGAASSYTDDVGNPINGSPGEANWAISVTATPSPVPTRTPIPPTRTPTSYPFQSVVLNEVLPRAGHDWNGDGVVDVNDEYIEIINRGVSTVTLAGWQLDDEKDKGSDPYRIPSITLQSGGRIAIFGYTSHISLSDGGDTVRLLNSNNQIVDVLTYTVIKEADQSWCRFPENGFWNPDCFPTPNEENTDRGILIDQQQDPVRFACLAPDTVPDSVSLIECGLLGMSLRDENFWDQDRSVLWLTGQNKHQTWFR